MTVFASQRLALGYDVAMTLRIDVLRPVLYALLTCLLIGCVSSPPDRTGVGQSRKQDPAPQRNPLEANREAQHCVALAMYWEARGEGRQGMLAVGSVVLNRVEDQRFPNSVCDVVYQGGETPPCQFSWWCDGKSDRPTDAALWSVSLDLADELMTADLHDPTYGALFFHSKSIRSPWRRTRTAEIGNHVFYR